MARLEAVTAGDARLTGETSAELAAFLKKLRARCSMDGAVDAAAAKQRLVGRVDDRIDVECGDVGADDLKGRYRLSASASGSPGSCQMRRCFSIRLSSARNPHLPQLRR